MSGREGGTASVLGRIAVAGCITASLVLGACGGSGGSSSDSGPTVQEQTYALSASVHGLASSGLVLMVNATAVTVPASTTTQSLASSLASGSQYSVTVQTQPTGETCTVADGTGTIGSANVANVVVTCADQAYPLGGTVSGLNGSGLVLADGSDTVGVKAGATSFTLPTPVAFTSSYQVTVQTQPSGEACAVAHGTGAMPASAVTNVAVTCTDQPFTLGGTISGLGNNTGLVLVNGGDHLSVAAGSTGFTLPAPVPFGSSYSVVVQSAPAGLTCTASNASGTMPASNVTNVLVTCSNQAYSVGGSITGLTATGLVLANGTDTLSVSTGATSFTMPSLVAFGSPYAVIVQTQPVGLTCSVSNGSGKMGTGAVTSVAVHCAASTYTVGGTVSGLTSSGLVLLNNGADATTISANAVQFTMKGGETTGSTYVITVQSQPTGETCTVLGGTGTINLANVANVVVTCSDQAYPLGGTISGLDSSGLVLANGSDTLNVTTGATGFTMPTPVAYTSSYAVKVQTQPEGQACSVSNGSGTMPASAVTNVSVTCSDQPFKLGGTITGLGNNSGLVLVNGTDTLNVSAGSSTFTMPTAVDYGSSYSVVVQSSPPGLTCTASNASGTMPANNVTTVVVTCSDQAYTLGGTISGLTASGLVLANGADTINVPQGATSFQMDQAVAYTSAYDVVAQTQPTGLTCSVSNGTGTMPASNITNVAVTCSTATYTVGGSITGLSATGLVLLDNGGDPTTISANATQFTMNTGVAYGSAYAITVQSQPTGLICSVSNGAGTVGAGDVTTISIACTWSTTTLYSLAGGSADGASPWDGLIQGNDGNLYGTTQLGGTNNSGTVFEVTPSGTESVLYSFGASGDGSGPLGALIQGSDGNFYGTTNIGGSGSYGTVFMITPGGTETVLYSFAGGTDGANPSAALVQGSDGNFYGTTYNGGSGNLGTVFQVTPSGTETVLYSFVGGSSDGANPYGALIQGSDGNFYGTTYSGGSNNLGTVFQVTPSGTETVLHSFGGGSSDGANPYAALIQGSDGNFYGTTLYGGPYGHGAVFKLAPSGTETVLHFFTGAGGDGAAPATSLLQASDGNFYGTTYAGGTSNDGTVFRLTPTGTETVLYSFGAAGNGDGELPAGAFVQGGDGNLYGTTQSGGANGFGTVFKVTLQ